MESKSISMTGEFAEAAQSWDLERLYIDLAKAKKIVAPHKKQGLTPIEKERLRGLLCGYSPAEIAQKLHLSAGGIQVAISDLYRYTEALTQRTAHSIKNWRDIVEWLEAAGYKKVPFQRLSSSPLKQTWESAPDVTSFYGRTEELNTLKQWIGRDNCRVITILGMGGIGKTSLAVKVAQELSGEFEYLIWQSLRYAPSFTKILTKLWAFFGESTTIDSSIISDSTSKILEILQRYRCLLILDGLEALLQPEALAGRYAPAYQAYQEFIKRAGEEKHKSCLMITSQEKTPEIAALMGSTLPVRTFSLVGLDKAAAQIILKDKGLPEQNNSHHLIDLYRGNPLALKIVAATIQDVFGGCVDEFLRSSSVFVGDFAEILSQQFQRLSPLEKQLLYALALERRPVTFFQLRDFLRNWVSTSQLTQGWESIGRRSLLENTAEGFTLQPVVMKYVTEQLIKQICNEVLMASHTQKLEKTSLLNHPLLLQFKENCKNNDKIFNYRAILLRIENELRVFLQDTEPETLVEKLTMLLELVPKPLIKI